MVFDLAQTDELLSTTRAVRRRLDLTRPVPRNTILDCIRISQQAPTASNGQTWRWMVVDDGEKRRRIAELYREAAGTMLSDNRNTAVAQGEEQTARVYESAEYLADHLHEVPIHVIACLVGRPPPGRGQPFFASIYPAVWSFQLALRARGLGTVLTTLLSLKEREVASLLGMPTELTHCALLPVAYTLGSDFKPAQRMPVETIVHWNSW